MMEAFSTALVTVALVLWFLATLQVGRGNRCVSFLRDVPAGKNCDNPAKVSVIIAARNEEDRIEAALRSVLDQSYSNLEVIVVNDRSTDDTKEILDRTARDSERLKIVSISSLPEGWLGKNYALYVGVSKASGEYYLFTDADVILERTVIARAVHFAVTKRIDHLAVVPDVKSPGVLLDVLVSTFALFFTLYTQPWKVSDPQSPRHIGVGAFNFLRADAYRKCGTHQAISLRPDDDLKLGKLIKKHGFHQRALFGKALLSVQWYASVRELMEGLKKNAFAGFEYRVWPVVAFTLVVLVLNWPFAALFLNTGWTRVGSALAVMFVLVLFVGASRHSSVKGWHGLAFPIGSLLFVGIIWRSVLATISRGGIDWRGTWYALEDLKKNKV